MRYEHLIRSTFDVVGTAGDEFLCKCPWHVDGIKPNLYVNGVRGVFICHSCGKKGHLKGISGKIPLPSSGDIADRLRQMRVVKDDHMTVYNERWLQQFDNDHKAWHDRQLSPDIISRFDLGYDYMKDVLTIPVRDSDGSLLGVITRRLDDQKPKYRYPRGFPIGRYLFAAWEIPSGSRQTVALVEGAIDAVACWDARVPALAMLGSRLTKDQAHVLKVLQVHTAVIFTDNDGPGRDAIRQVSEALRAVNIGVKVAQYRPYWRVKDPADLTPQRRRKAYHSAVPWHRFVELGLQTE